MVADVSYVGNHGYNQIGAFQGGDLQNLDSVDYGTTSTKRMGLPWKTSRGFIRRPPRSRTCSRGSCRRSGRD